MKISIILVHFSTDDFKSEQAIKCLSIVKSTLNENCELILVNNGERDKELKNDVDIYIKNDKNSLGKARNLGFDKSSGEYVCFIDNDIIPQKGWWQECIKLLEKYTDKKLIASPVYNTGHIKKYSVGELDGNPLNLRSGSNCLLMKRESFLDIGSFLEGDGKTYDSWIGIEFCNRQIRKGYLMILTNPPMAIDEGATYYRYKY